MFFTRFFLLFVGEYLSIPLHGSQHIAPIFSNTNNLTVNIKVEDVVVEVVFSVT